MTTLSLVEELRELPELQREAALAEFAEEELAELYYDWDFWARPNQRSAVAIRPRPGLYPGRSAVGWGKKETSSPPNILRGGFLLKKFVIESFFLHKFVISLTYIVGVGGPILKARATDYFWN